MAMVNTVAMVEWRSPSIAPTAMPHDASCPSPAQLWARVQALVQTTGRQYAARLERSRVESPVAMTALALGTLGPRVPQAPLVEALAQRPVLWEPDDGSEDWKTAWLAFMGQARDVLEQAGPQALEGLAGGVAFRPRAGLAGNAAAAERALRQADRRWRKLLHKIRTEPSQVTQSVLKHLSSDAAAWHNSLLVSSRQAGEPVGGWMRAMGQVIRKGLVPELFNATELALVARHAMDAWLAPSHQARTTLRLRAAMVLGQMLQDEERRGHALAVLEKAGFQEALEVARPLSATADRRAALALEVHGLAQEILEDECFDGAGDSSLSAACESILQGQAAGLLPEMDWHMACLLDQPGQGPGAGAARREIFMRLVAAVEDSVDPDVLLAPDAAGPSAPAARRLGP